MASNLTQENHHHELLNHQQNHHLALNSQSPRIDNNLIPQSDSIRQDRLIANQDHYQQQHFVFGQPLSINLHAHHQAQNLHQHAQLQQQNLSSGQSHVTTASMSSSSSTSTASLPNIFDNSNINQRLVPLAFGQQSLTTTNSGLTDTLGLTASTHTHQLMILQQQQHQSLHFPINGAHIHDTNFNAAAFLQHQSTTNISVASSPPVTSANTTSTNSLATSGFPQIHLQSNQPHYHVVATHNMTNLDNINITGNAGQVLLDPATCNDLLKLNNGSADGQTSFEGFGSTANSLCQISNYSINQNVNFMNGSNDTSSSNIEPEINNNDNNPSNRVVNGDTVSSLNGRGRNSIQNSDFIDSGKFLTDTVRSTSTFTNNNPSGYILNGHNYSTMNKMVNNGQSLSPMVNTSTISTNGIGHTPISMTKNSKTNAKKEGKVSNRKLQSESPKRIFACPNCKKEFTEKFNMKRHMQIHSPSRPKFVCNQCSKSFAWKDNFIRHRKAAHSNGDLANNLQPCAM